MYSTRNNSRLSLWSAHCMSLTAISLTISKTSTVKSTNCCSRNCIFISSFVDFRDFTILIEYLICKSIILKLKWKWRWKSRENGFGEYWIRIWRSDLEWRWSCRRFFICESDWCWGQNPLRPTQDQRALKPLGLWTRCGETFCGVEFGMCESEGSITFHEAQRDSEIEYNDWIDGCVVVD